MEVVRNIIDLRSKVSEVKKRGDEIGFIPTMGALHNGHISLVKTAVAANKFVVVSVFVNPTQFNNPEDLEKYPRDLESDLALLETANCDMVFAPEANEMYPSKPAVSIQFGELASVMEGAFRPGHFDGVGLVVSKLFNLVQPTRAYFGQKDFQQLAIIKKMVQDLNFNIEIVPLPIIREADGLAMSSRNMRLTPEARKQAPAIYTTLEALSNKIRQKVLTIAEAKAFFKEQIDAHSSLDTEYIEIVNSETLLPVNNPEEAKSVTICVAVFAGKIRLIDNVSIF